MFQLPESLEERIPGLTRPDGWSPPSRALGLALRVLDPTAAGVHGVTRRTPGGAMGRLLRGNLKTEETSATSSAFHAHRGETRTFSRASPLPVFLLAKVTGLGMPTRQNGTPLGAVGAGVRRSSRGS